MTDFSYYLTPYINALRELPGDADPEERKRLENLICVNIGDPDVLADILGHTPEPFDDFYGERAGVTPDTEDTIESFLSNFGAQGANSRSLPDELPLAPAIDYASMYLDGDSDPNTESIAKTSIESDRRDDEKSPEKAPLTESLVKILVKNGKYEDALQIISELNLKNPEKSIYFADQMRFLRKILICKSKSNT